MSAPRYEVRACWRYDRGRILRADHPLGRPAWTHCSHCGGTGRVRVYLYPERKLK